MRKIQYDNEHIDISLEWSHKDFTGHFLRDKQIKPGTVIYQSCFQQHEPDTKIFPKDMHGVTFLNCNLNNVFVPKNNIIRGGTRCRHYVFDGHDWELDETDKPIKMVNEKLYRMMIERESEEKHIAQIEIVIPKVQNRFFRYLKRIWRLLWQ